MFDVMTLVSRFRSLQFLQEIKAQPRIATVLGPYCYRSDIIFVTQAVKLSRKWVFSNSRCVGIASKPDVLRVFSALRMTRSQVDACNLRWNFGLIGSPLFKLVYGFWPNLAPHIPKTRNRHSKTAKYPVQNST